MGRYVKTAAICFPFDLFGSSGASVGAQALADALREILEDNRRETVPTRADAYRDRVQLREFSFETLESYRDWRDQARRAARAVLRNDRFLIWLTGNHLGVLPVYEELAAGGKTVVVQFDAHLDIQNFADSTKNPSHGNFLLHADGPLPMVVNLGHRDLLLRPNHIKKSYHRAISAAELAQRFTAVVEEVVSLCQAADRVFLDLDCDVFNPACFGAVTHPVPFGLRPTDLLPILDAIWSEKVAGVAISEFDPGRDHNDQCLATLAWFLEYILLKRHE